MKTKKIEGKRNRQILAIGLTMGSFIFAPMDVPHLEAGWDSCGGNCNLSNNIGIGTSNPTPHINLEIDDPNKDAILLVKYSGPYKKSGVVRVQGNSTDHSSIDFASEISAARGRIKYSHPEESFWFITNDDHGSPRMSIDRNGRVGIGTTTPQGKFHINTQGVNDWFYIEDSSLGPVMSIVDDGVATVRLEGRAGLPHYFLYGYMGLGTASPQAKLDINDDGSATNLLRVVSNGDVKVLVTKEGNGHFKGIEVKNQISSNSIETGSLNLKTDQWADFVFDESYSLMPLDQVEKSIKKNGHLPQIPSEKEVKEKGIDLGVMQAKLLQKIEELTLYVIGQNKEIETLKRTNALQEGENNKLMERLSFLEKSFSK